MLALHALWSPGRGLRLWAEDALALPAAARRPRSNGKGGRKNPQVAPPPHPFAAGVDQLIDALGERVLGVAEVTELELLLPGAPSRPFASSTAKRLAREPHSSARPRLRPWRVPTLSFDAAASLDVLLALADAPPPAITPGDSVGFLVRAAELTLDLVTRGRIVPGLVMSDEGRSEARWLPAPTSAEVAAAGALAAAMPPLLLAQPTAGERAEPVNPTVLVAEVLTVLVDTAARQAVAGSRLAPPRRGRRPKVLPPVEAFLAALTADDPVVVGDPGELTKLARALDEWRRSGLRSTGALRTCFRLMPPGGESNEPDVDGAGPLDDPDAEAPWRLEFLLQSTSDPSLLVPAGEVWRSGPALASIDLGDESPRERLLGDLGHAARLLPDLERALQAPHPEDLELDTQGAYRFLSEGALVLEQAGFGILVPPWWRTDASRLGLKLRVRSLGGDEGDGLPSLLGMEALCDYHYEVALGDGTLSPRQLRELARLKAPLVRVKGRWVELRPDDLRAALEILERQAAGEAPDPVTAAAALRVGLGLDPADVDLPVVGVEADGWLGELLSADGDRRLEPMITPAAFEGTLRPYQERGLGWLWFLDRLGLGACLADDMGLGKAQPLDANVLTPTGWTPMGEVRVGDEVIGSDGKPHRVIGVYPQGSRPISRVTFSDGSSTECDDEHLWAVNTPERRHRGQPHRVLSLREIRHKLRDAAGNRRHFITLVSPVQFDGGTPPLDPYLLGVLLGDGGLSDNRVRFSTRDDELAERIRAVLPAGVRLVHKGGYDFRVLAPYPGAYNPVLDALRRLGLLGKRSEEKFIPDPYRFAALHERVALLQGLLDTDGHVRPSDNNVEYTTVSARLARNVQELVQSLGGTGRIRTKRTSRQLAYRMSIALPSEILPFRLGRKAAVYHPRQKYPPSRSVVSVESIGMKPAQCIAVDTPDNLYVTDDFIVTHNTPQLLALLLAERAHKNGAGRKPRVRPTLLVCPMSVVGNWQREAERFAPSLGVHVHHGAERETGTAFAKAAKKADLVITTYALVARDAELLEGVEWGRLALDEAQNVKNPDAKQAKAVRSLRAARRVALTGTPVENRLTELWSIMEFLNPGLLGKREAFRSRFAVRIERYGDDQAARTLKRVTGPFILRRLKTDRSIIADLPDKVEMKVFCNLTREQATLYQAVVDDMLVRLEETEGIQRKGVILSTMTKLKQVCNHPAHLLGDGSRLEGRSGKLARFEEILEEVGAEGDRVLCFTQFTEMGRLLHSHLQERVGCDVPFLHGGVPKRRRDEMVEAFQAGEGPSVFLLSLKAGGVGLNLTAANHVVHFDRWWNPAVEDQATDRAFRIGQRKDVQVRKFVCVGTLEERIDELIERKRDLAERIVGSGEAWLTELSTEQIREMVALSADAVAEG